MIFLALANPPRPRPGKATRKARKTLFRASKFTLVTCPDSSKAVRAATGSNNKPHQPHIGHGNTASVAPKGWSQKPLVNRSGFNHAVCGSMQAAGWKAATTPACPAFRICQATSA